MTIHNPFWQGFNYSIFDNDKISQEDTKNRKKISSLRTLSIIAILFILIVLPIVSLIMFFIFIAIFKPSITEISGFFPKLIITMIGASVAVIIIYLSKLKKIKIEAEQIPKRIAQINNLNVVPEENFILNTAYTGFGYNGDIKATIIVETKPEMPYPVYFANWTHTTYTSQKQRILYDKTLMRITLPKKLPTLLLQTKITNTPIMVKDFTNNKSLGLPPRIDNLYKGHNITGTENDFYYIFSPDVLQAILENTIDGTVLIIEDKLYIIEEYRFDLSTPEGWKQLEVRTNTVGRQIIEQVNRWNR